MREKVKSEGGQKEQNSFSHGVLARRMRLRPRELRKPEVRLTARLSDPGCAAARRAASLTREWSACLPPPGRRIAADGSRPMKLLQCNKRHIPPGNFSSGCSLAN